MSHVKWSKTEKKIAREAFERAYDRECSYLAGRIREKVNEIKKKKDGSTGIRTQIGGYLLQCALTIGHHIRSSLQLVIITL